MKHATCVHTTREGAHTRKKKHMKFQLFIVGIMVLALAGVNAGKGKGKGKGRGRGRGRGKHGGHQNCRAYFSHDIKIVEAIMKVCAGTCNKTLARPKRTTGRLTQLLHRGFEDNCAAIKSACNSCIFRVSDESERERERGYREEIEIER